MLVCLNMMDCLARTGTSVRSSDRGGAGTAGRRAAQRRKQRAFWPEPPGGEVCDPVWPAASTERIGTSRKRPRADPACPAAAPERTGPAGNGHARQLRVCLFSNLNALASTGDLATATMISHEAVDSARWRPGVCAANQRDAKYGLRLPAYTYHGYQLQAYIISMCGACCAETKFPFPFGQRPIPSHS